MTNIHSAQARLTDLLSKVGRRMRVLYDARLKQHGLTLARARVLLALNNKSRLRQKDLAACLTIETATLVRLLDTLEQQDFIQRHAASHDRRTKYIVLTDKGVEMVDALEKMAHNLRSELLEGLTKQQLCDGIDILSHMADRIRGANQ